jgi:hypothetical protein
MAPSACRATSLGYTTAGPAAAAIATLCLTPTATAAAAAGALPLLPLLFLAGVPLCAGQLGSIGCCVLLLLLMAAALLLLLLPAVLAMVRPWGLLRLLLPAATQITAPAALRWCIAKSQGTGAVQRAAGHEGAAASVA